MTDLKSLLLKAKTGGAVSVAPAPRGINPLQALMPTKTIQPTQSMQSIQPKQSTKTIPTPGKHDILHGTGITKALVAKQETAFRLNIKETQKAGQEILNKTNPFHALLKKQEKDKQAEITMPTAQQLESQPPIVQMPVQKPSEMQYDVSQLAAIEGITKEQYAVLIGAAGTGKTTVTKEIITRIQHQIPTIDLRDARNMSPDDYAASKQELNVAICFCAFTGRAVQQLKRAIPKQYHPMCNTIHATLGYMPVGEERKQEDGAWKEVIVFRPTFTRHRKLPYKVVIMDESGMTPVNLWNELIDALPDDARIILIGDINQLPPVQGRSVLGFAMVNWPTFELTTIHRQAADNPIIANAHKILKGHLPQKYPGTFDIVEIQGGSIAAFNAAVTVVKRMHQAGKFDPFKDGLIVPQNIGEIGQIALNENLVHYFNPERKENGIPINKRHLIKAGSLICHYAIGDKIMLLQNDREKNLTNGMTGEIVAVNLNGSYEGEYKHGMESDKNATFDVHSFTLEEVSTTADARKKDEKEDENKRQASHVTVVRFGTPTKSWYEIKAQIDILNEALTGNTKTLQNTKFAGFDTHKILQEIALLEYALQKEDSGQEVEFRTAGQYKKFTHAYAFTCHKSQGGEYPSVIILAHSATLKMLTREWLYTAVTRAQQRVILICNGRGLTHALNNQRIKGKTIKEKAQSFLDLQDRTDVSLPDLPIAKKWELKK